MRGAVTETRAADAPGGQTGTGIGGGPRASEGTEAGRGGGAAGATLEGAWAPGKDLDVAPDPAGSL